MSIMPTPEINAMIFALTGEFLTTIDEDLADQSQYNFTGMARKIEQLSGLIEKSVHDIAQAMPDELAVSYKQAMGTLIDDQGKNYLLEFTKQLDQIGAGRRKTGMDVMESKWQVIAEIIRLLIEIAIYLALSFFTGGASASQILMAKLRSRFVLLTLFSHLMKRLHLMPSLSEALAEAFTTFAVRLAMMNFAPEGRRPDGIDWGDIGKAAAFGAAAGFFTSVFENWAKNIVKSYDMNFLKDGLPFKDRPGPGPDLKFDTPNPNPTPNPKPGPGTPTPEPKPKPEPTPQPKPTPTPEPTPGPKPGPDPSPEPGPRPKPGPEPDPVPGGGPQDRPRPRPDLDSDLPAFLRDRPFTFRYDPAVWRSNPDLWRNYRLLENNADRPGALAGHYGLKGVLDFAAAGGGETVGEILIKGAFEGDFSSNWTTFVGAGVSSKVEGGLSDIALNTGNELRTAIENLRNQPPTISGGAATDTPARTGDGDGSGRSGDGPPRTESSGGGFDGDGPGAPRPTGLDEFTGSSPRPVVAESPPPYTPQDPPAYVPVDPPAYTPGPLPVTAAENALWQQVHQGPPEVRDQALRDLAALRGERPPGPAEIGVRDGLHGNLSQLPEIRVVPTGNGPAALVDADEVRRALESLGTPVTVNPPGTGEGTPTPLPGPGTPTGSAPGGVDTVDRPGTTPGEGTATGPGDGVRDTPGSGQAPSGQGPETRDTADEGSTSGGREVGGEGPESRDGTGPVASPGTGTDAPLTVIVAENLPPAAEGSPEAAALLDGAGVDRAVVLGPPGGGDAALPERGAVELTREGPGAPVQVRPLTGPEFAGGPDAQVDTAFPGANVLLPLADALGVPPVVTAPPPGATAAPPATTTGGPTSTTPNSTTTSATPNSSTSPAPRPGTPGGPADNSGSVQQPSGEGTPENPGPAEPGQDDAESPAVKAAESGTTTDPGTIDGPGADARPADTTGTTTGPEESPGSRPAVVTTSSDLPTDTGSPATTSGREPTVDVKPPVTSDSGPESRSDVKPPVTTSGREPGADVKPPVTSTAGPESPSDVKPPVTPSGRESAPDVKPPVVTASTVTAEGPAVSKLAADARPWSEAATEVHLEGGREGNTGPETGGTPSRTGPDSGPTPGALVTTSTTPATRGGTVPTPTAGPSVTTLGGKTVPFSELRRLVASTEAAPQPGTAVRTVTISQSPAEDGTGRSAGRQALLGQDTFRGVRTTSEETPGADGTAPPPRTVFTGAPAPLPGSGTERGADYFVGHGTPRTVTLGTDNAAHPTVEVSGVQLGEVLKSWAQDGDQDRPLVLFSCETGQQPRIAGLPVAQHVANRTGRPVYAPTTEAGTAKDRDGNVRAVLGDGSGGPGRWRLFTPEPSGSALDDLARDAGLHSGPDPADAFARARTLQQIRTLREALGPDAEQRPGNQEALAALAYVDGLRWRDPGTAARYGDGRMTPDLLDRMVADWHAATGDATAVDPSTGPTPDQYTAFLEAAAALRSGATPTTTLDSLLPPPPAPPPSLAPDTLVSRSDVSGLAYARSAEVAWSLSDAPLPVSQLGLGPEDSAELARRLEGTGPAPGDWPESIAEDVDLFSEGSTVPALPDTVDVAGVPFRKLPARADGDCLFRALLDSARGTTVPPAWAARNVAGLRNLLRDRLTGSELLGPAAEATPDPVLAVVDDLRMTALAGVSHPEARDHIGRRWDRIAQEVVTDGDGRRWRRILRESGYPRLAEVAPTPADARRIGTGGLIVEAAGERGLWSSPFADVLPLALAHTLDVELRLVGPDPTSPGHTFTAPLNPGGDGGVLHLAYNGSDHYDALVPAAAIPTPTTTSTPTPLTTPTPAPPTAPATPDPAGSDVFGEWLRSMGGVTDLDTPPPSDPDRGDPVPLETQLDRHRPARLLTGDDARPPGAAPRTVTFDDGSRLPAVLISPDADPDDGGTGPSPRNATGPRTGLLNGVGILTLRSPDQVAQEVFDQLPEKLRTQFDRAEVERLLKDQPGAFTAPRGARFVGREKSGVGHEMIVEAVPYHRWERFSDVGGATVRVDTMRRGQAGYGGGRSVGTGRRIALAIGMGPPLDWMLKIGVSLGWTRKTDYTQGTQAYHQSEYRSVDGSHLHLDDVHYRVRVERVTEAPKTPGPAATTPGTPPATAPRWQRTEVHSARFALRDGLSWRLPDELTVPFKGPQRAPRTLTFPDGAEPRITDTTALHLTDPPEDVALAISGARPGSSAHRTLVSYVRPGRLLGLFGRFSGPVSGPELTRGSGQHPLGHLVVERSIPHRATLVTESVTAEVRDLTQTTYQNQRAHTRDTRLGVQITAGPNSTVIGPETDVRIQGGPMVRADLSAGRGHNLGTDAARKVTGRVRNHPVALYRVERTLMVRGAGQPASAARPVRVVSLDWISTQDARRLAGWDSRTPGATGPNADAEPPVPWYLTREDPVHLGGQVRAEGFVPDRRPAPPATITPAPATTPTPTPAPVPPTAPAPATTPTTPAPAT
ncbi:hypothetical protein GA0115244_12051, partial [Streptomyces sp. DvalAA-19]